MAHEMKPAAQGLRHEQPVKVIAVMRRQRRETEIIVERDRFQQ